MHGIGSIIVKYFKKIFLWKKNMGLSQHNFDMIPKNLQIKCMEIMR